MSGYRPGREATEGQRNGNEEPVICVYLARCDGLIRVIMIVPYHTTI